MVTVPHPQIKGNRLKLCPTCDGTGEGQGLREKLIEWVADYKDAAERNALAETPEESAAYLLSIIRKADRPDREKIAEELYYQHKGEFASVDIAKYRAEHKWWDELSDYKRVFYVRADQIIAVGGGG